MSDVYIIPDESHLPWSERSAGARHRKWVEVTTNGLARWRRAQGEFYSTRWYDPGWTGRGGAIARVMAERRHYREWILGWFWALVAPIRSGGCVPREVAELLAEEWDERGKIMLAPRKRTA